MRWTPLAVPLLALGGCGPGDTDTDPCTTRNWYEDRDGDGYGEVDLRHSACEAPEGYVDNSADCDDSQSTVYPGAEEVCDFLDNNCDGQKDEGVEPVEVFPDGDGDGYGPVGAEGELTCEPGDRATGEGDCDDADPEVSPGTPERVCDGTDQDCDGVDNHVALDGHGAASLAAAAGSAEQGSIIELCAGEHAADLVFDGLDVTVQGAGELPADVVLRGGLSMSGGTLTLAHLELTGERSSAPALLDVANGQLVATDIRLTESSLRGLRIATGETDDVRRSVSVDGALFEGTDGALLVEHHGQQTLEVSLSEVVADSLSADDGVVVLRSSKQLEVDVVRSSFDDGAASGLNGLFTLDTSYRIDLTLTESSVDRAVLGGGAAISAIGDTEVLLQLVQSSITDAYSTGYAAAIARTGPGWVALTTDRSEISGNVCSDVVGAAAVRLGASGAVASIATDWGTDPDNVPADLSSSGSLSADLGAQEDFTCVPGDGCSFD